MRWLDGITDSKDMSLSRLWEIVKDREARHAAFPGITKSQTRMGDWITTTTTIQPITTTLKERDFVFFFFHSKDT